MTIVLAEDDSQAMRSICPPCTGDCNQGRNCPARIDQDDPLGVFLGLKSAMVIMAGVVGCVGLAFVAALYWQ